MRSVLLALYHTVNVAVGRSDLRRRLQSVSEGDGRDIVSLELISPSLLLLTHTHTRSCQFILQHLVSEPIPTATSFKASTKINYVHFVTDTHKTLYTLRRAALLDFYIFNVLFHARVDAVMLGGCGRLPGWCCAAAKVS